MFTVRRIGWTLTSLVAAFWLTIVVSVLIRNGAPPYRVFSSLVAIGLLWIALALIALIWIVLWFGGGFVCGVRGEKVGRPESSRARHA
jgi:uncharacterized membrane protein